MAEGDRLRLLLVDDHAVVREGLERIIARCDDLVVVAAASSGREALDLAQRLRPDLVLLDLSLPDMPGLDVLAGLRSEPESPRVLVLTIHDDDDVVLEAVRAGAEGYVLKTASREELLAAVRRVGAGGHAFDEVVIGALLRRETPRAGVAELSGREREVLQLVAEGLTNRDVAARLFLSADTVNGHLDNIYRKLGVSDRAHAVAVALRRGILE
jgi:DNA-binding NarL/FixJ family response regulator